MSTNSEISKFDLYTYSVSLICRDELLFRALYVYQDLGLDPVVYGQPVKLLQDWCDVTTARCSDGNARCCVLDTL